MSKTKYYVWLHNRSDKHWTITKIIPIKGAIENEVIHLPILANPIADATSSNDSVYTNGPFPGIPLANIPYRIQQNNKLGKVFANVMPENI